MSTVANSNQQLLWWALTIAYIGVTYATLGEMPAYWEAINDALSGRGLLFQYALYSIVGLALFGYLHRQGFLRKPRHWAATAAFVLAFTVMFYLQKNPGEKIHMLQYGVLGWLLYKAFSLRLDRNAPRLYVFAGAAVMAAGAVDEVIQWLLPNRYFTLHDVFINGLSGILVQLYIWYYVTRRGTGSPGFPAG